MVNNDHRVVVDNPEGEESQNKRQRREVHFNLGGDSEDEEVIEERVQEQDESSIVHSEISASIGDNMRLPVAENRLERNLFSLEEMLSSSISNLNEIFFLRTSYKGKK